MEQVCTDDSPFRNNDLARCIWIRRCFFDLFAYGNQNLAENTEAIWTIQFEPLITGGTACRDESWHGPCLFQNGDTLMD